jgi:hypothetical protein
VNAEIIGDLSVGCPTSRRPRNSVGVRDSALPDDGSDARMHVRSHSHLTQTP